MTDEPYRAAVSAALAADWLTRPAERPDRIGFVGAGSLSTRVYEELIGTGWRFDEVGVHDPRTARAFEMARHIRRRRRDAKVLVHDNAKSVVWSSDLVVLAVDPAAEYLRNPFWFQHNPLVLNVLPGALPHDVVAPVVNINLLVENP
jgi:ornithine cyclodeaminase